MANIEDRFRAQLDAWRKDLINLTRNNRLIYLKPGSVLEVVEPGSLDVYRRLGAGLQIAGLREDDLFEEGHTRLRANEVRFGALARSTHAAKLRNLERTATQTFMDRGLWVLYLGFGLLEWDEAPDTVAGAEKIYSPLLLVPVTLKRESARDPFELKRAAEEQRFNPALVAKLEEDFGLELTLPADEDEVELEELFSAIGNQVARRGWKVLPRTVLSTFSFHKEPILRDLVKNEEQVMTSDAVRALALRSESGVSLEFEPVDEMDLDRDAPPERTVTIRDADASQRKAIAAAAAGQSFVMDGPPGTGKSQTIANIIADLLAKQKTVLFVSEKAAALEVVFDRLDEAGLSEFVLELHSHKATRKEVAKALGKSLQTRVNVGDAMPESEREQLRRKREELSAYVTALNAPRAPLGQSLQRVIGLIARSQHLPQAPPPRLRVADLDQVRWARIAERADALGRAWGPISRGGEFVWRDLAPGVWDTTRRVVLVEELETAFSRLATLSEISGARAAAMELLPPTHVRDAERLHAVENHLAQRAYAYSPWLTLSSIEDATRRLGEAMRAAARAEQIEEMLAHELGGQWHELRSDGPELLRSLTEALKRVCAEFPVVDAATTVTLGQSRQAIHEAEALLRGCRTTCAPLLAAFELDPLPISLMRAFQLAQLAALSSADELPEPSWLSLGGLDKAKAALGRLRPLLGDMRRWEMELRATFTRGILELDLETLCIRFESVYQGVFRWFSSDYRRDRRALKGTTRSGRLRREELSRLSDALKWQQALRTFQGAAADAASILWVYLRGEETDCDRAERACAVAEKVIELAMTDIAPDVLAQRVSTSAKRDPELLSASTRTSALEGVWKGLNVEWADLEQRPLAEAADRARMTVDAATPLIDQLTLVDGVARRPIPLGDALRWLGLRREHELIGRSFADFRDADTALYGAIWRGRSTDWAGLSQGLQWAADIRNLLGGAVSTRCGERLVTMPAEPPQLSAPLREWAASVSGLVQNFSKERAGAVQDVLCGALGDADGLLEDFLATLDDIGEWYAHVHAIEQLSEEGLGAAVQFCMTREVLAEHVRPILERALLESWTDDVLKGDVRLTTIRAEDRDALGLEFRRLDRKLVTLAARDAIEQCSKRRPKIFQGAAGIILHEAEKQKKHMPVRELIQRTREVVQAVKPCFMMSPLSVSQFLPKDILFDLVIFDEASQVRPADAISSIYRAKQLIVAGDQKQLPPTSFFERLDSGDEDGYEEEEPGQFESVLDLCKGSGAFTSLPLRWHYRSQHEHLIAYSNHKFYDGTLITFPSIINNAPDLGVEVFQADGVYRRAGQRDNPIEAALVGERVLFHARNHPGLSMGVVAFSEAQASTIDAVIERLADEHAEIRQLKDESRLSGLFVKNLETVQGDERDIIIFSMGYGKDEAGKFTMNFGPVSRNGGERRLNVAITRARRRIEFITSVRLSDFPRDVGALGSQHLKKYLEFAERVEDRLAVLAIPLTPSLGDFESPFEIEVARVVRSWGFDVVPQVGCSDYRIDLGVTDQRDASRFVLGIECDGAMYHSSRVARDRDRLRQEVLQRLGWRLHRIWGPSWYRHRSEQEKRLREAIDDAMSGGPTKTRMATPAKSVETPRTKTVEWNPGVMPNWVILYESTRLPRLSVHHDMHEASALEDVKRIIVAVVRAEGPVHAERVLRIARRAFGAERSGQRIQEAFDRACRAAERSEPLLRRRRNFLWLEGQAVRVRCPRDNEPETERSVSEVSPQELEMAVLKAVKDALRIDRSELVTYVGRLFGWDRNGARIASAIENAVKVLLKRGALLADDEALVPVLD